MPLWFNSVRIDAHVHAFPERLAHAVRNALNGMGGLTDSPLLADVARKAQDDGFDAAWVLPYAHRPGIAESLNVWSAAEVTRYPWLVAGATFHPGDEDLDRLVHSALVESKLRVVKLHCSVGRFSPSDPRLAPLWEVASELGVAVVVHAGQIGPGGTEASEIGELEPVLRAFPDLRLVVAHSGHPNPARTLELMERYANLYGDLTPVGLSPVELTATDFARFPGRVLFGSDAPNNPTSARAQAERWRDLVADDTTFASIIGGAAASLVRVRRS